MKGTIKKKTDKGFGFINTGGAKDLFFHSNSCTTPFDQLQEGDEVNFQESDSPKGPCAIDVELAA